MLPECTEGQMRLQSFLVQLSKKTADFSSTEETKLGRKKKKENHMFGWQMTQHLSGFEGHLKMDVRRQQPPGLQR